jgi:hypothetical protein
MGDIKIFCTTCDKYHHILKVFCYLYEKFWNDPITVLGYKKPSFQLPENFTFHSMGKDRGIKFWSNDLIRFFSKVNAEKYIWMMEDTFILEKIDRKTLVTLYDSIEPNIIRAELSGTMTHRNGKWQGKATSDAINTIEYYKTVDGVKLYKMPFWGKTFMPVSVWNKRQFLKYIDKNQNPWEFEKKGSKKAMNHSDFSICTNAVENLAVNYSEGVLNGNPYMLRFTSKGKKSNSIYRRFLPEEIIKDMQDKKLIGERVEAVGWRARDKWFHCNPRTIKFL